MSDDLSLKTESVSIPRAPGSGPMKPKSRRRVNTAEKRVQHNAIERQRRETLNGKFLNLARLLPSLANLRRPSKSAIVNGSISHLNHQRQQRLNAAQELRRLVKERDELFAEVNEWRAISGQPIRKGDKSGWTDIMEEVAAVDNETFGTFTSVGGEQGGDDNDNDDEQDNVQVPTHGLITPRTSTDGELATSLSTSPFAAQPSIHSAAPEFANFTFATSQPTTAMPMNVFLSDPYDQQSNQSDSPLGSASQGHGVPTPPTTAHDQFTPSPSASAEDARVQQWTAQQLLYQLQRQQQQQHHQQSAYFGGYPSALPSQYQNVIYPPPVNTNGGVDAFTSTLMQSVFPQGQGLEMSAQQVDQWRRIAMGGMMQQQQPNPSMHDLRQAVRAGMGIGFGLSSTSPTSAGPGGPIPAPWGQEPVKGF